MTIGSTFCFLFECIIKEIVFNTVCRSCEKYDMNETGCKTLSQLQHTKNKSKFFVSGDDTQWDDF